MLLGNNLAPRNGSAVDDELSVFVHGNDIQSANAIDIISLIKHLNSTRNRGFYFPYHRVDHISVSFSVGMRDGDGRDNCIREEGECSSLAAEYGVESHQRNVVTATELINFANCLPSFNVVIRLPNFLLGKMVCILQFFYSCCVISQAINHRSAKNVVGGANGAGICQPAASKGDQRSNKAPQIGQHPISAVLSRGRDDGSVGEYEADGDNTNRKSGADEGRVSGHVATLILCNPLRTRGAS